MDVNVVDQNEQPFLGMHEVVRISDLTEFFGRAYTAVGAELGKQGLAPAGPPVALYDSEVGETADVTAGFPTQRTALPADGLVVAVLPAGRAAVTVHEGAYDAMATTYAALMAWFEEEDLTPGPVMWEEYLVGPDSSADPAQWRTQIVWPVS
jgi:effector-binding domain-containing protein